VCRLLLCGVKINYCCVALKLIKILSCYVTYDSFNSVVLKDSKWAEMIMDW